MDLGSTPGSASISCLAASGSTPDTFAEKQPDARVVKLVDTRDLKSLAGNSVPVQVRPRAPIKFLLNTAAYEACSLQLKRSKNPFHNISEYNFRILSLFRHKKTAIKRLFNLPEIPDSSELKIQAPFLQGSSNNRDYLRRTILCMLHLQ